MKTDTGPEIECARDAAVARQSMTPRALAVLIAPDGRLQIELSSGLGLLVDPQRVQGLERATAADLTRAEISPSGFGLHFPTLDADLYVPGLLEGHLGSARHMAALLGARGGRSTSPAKAASSRSNGRRGGRPRKTPAA